MLPWVVKWRSRMQQSDWWDQLVWDLPGPGSGELGGHSQRSGH